MDDWLEPALEDREDAAPRPRSCARRAPIRRSSTRSWRCSPTRSSPAFVAGAGNDNAEGWAALAELAERLAAPVFQESFGARAGFPQDHRHFAGVLPADRPRLRERLAPFDVVVAVGAPVFRQSPYAEGRFANEGTRLAIVSDDAGRGEPRPVELGVLAPPAAVCRELAKLVPRRDASRRRSSCRRPAPAPRRAADRARTSSRRSRSGCRETRWSSRRRRSTGRSCTTACSRASRSASSAPRWAGSASRIPGATGVRMALPERPVVGGDRRRLGALRHPGRSGARRTTASACSS